MSKELYAVGAFIGLCALAMYEGSQRESKKPQILIGGIGDETLEEEVDQDELASGIEIEMEHTSDPEIAKEIALDHLTEDAQYYTKLKTLEL